MVFIHVFWWTISLFEEDIWVLIKTQNSAQKRKSSFFKVMAMGHAMHELNLQTLVSNWLTSTLKMPWHVPLHVLHLIKPAHTHPLKSVNAISSNICLVLSEETDLSNQPCRYDRFWCLTVPVFFWEPRLTGGWPAFPVCVRNEKLSTKYKLVLLSKIKLTLFPCRRNPVTVFSVPLF